MIVRCLSGSQFQVKALLFVVITAAEEPLVREEEEEERLLIIIKTIYSCWTLCLQQHVNYKV